MHFFFLTYLNLCAWWCTGPPNRLAGEWHSCDNSATFLFWLGLAANFTVMGSEEPGGLWPLKFVIASSASDLLSNRINATPLDKPCNQTNKKNKQNKKKTTNKKKIEVQDKLKITLKTKPQKSSVFLWSQLSSSLHLHFFSSWRIKYKIKKPKTN